MGYTHYFTLNELPTKQQWRRIRDKFAGLVSVLPDRSEGAGGYHAQDVLAIKSGLLGVDEQHHVSYDTGRGYKNSFYADDDTIIFEGFDPFGFADLDHENMVLARSKADFGCCKTARKPYDLAVCGLLLIAMKEAPGCWDVSSDGEFADWRQAIELVYILYNGESLSIPDDINPRIAACG